MWDPRLGRLKMALGIRILSHREYRKFWLCQDSYIEKITRRFHLEDRKGPVTPISSEKLKKYDENYTITGTCWTVTGAKAARNPFRHMEAVDWAIVDWRAGKQETVTRTFWIGIDQDSRWLSSNCNVAKKSRHWKSISDGCLENILKFSSILWLRSLNMGGWVYLYFRYKYANFTPRYIEEVSLSTFIFLNPIIFAPPFRPTILFQNAVDTIQLFSPFLNSRSQMAKVYMHQARRPEETVCLK